MLCQLQEVIRVVRVRCIGDTQCSGRSGGSVCGVALRGRVILVSLTSREPRAFLQTKRAALHQTPDAAWQQYADTTQPGAESLLTYAVENAGFAQHARGDLNPSHWTGNGGGSQPGAIHFRPFCVR